MTDDTMADSDAIPDDVLDRLRAVAQACRDSAAAKARAYGIEGRVAEMTKDALVAVRIADLESVVRALGKGSQ